jgi:hypothetical protein
MNPTVKETARTFGLVILLLVAVALLPNCAGSKRVALPEPPDIPTFQCSAPVYNEDTGEILGLVICAPDAEAWSEWEQATIKWENWVIENWDAKD